MSYLVVFEVDAQGLMPITLALGEVETGGEDVQRSKVQDNPYLQSKLEARLDSRRSCLKNRLIKK